MFHLAVNYGSLDNTPLTAVNALNDDVLSIRDSKHTPGENLEMFACLPSGALLLRARDVTPNVAKMLNSYLSPINPNAAIQIDQLVREQFERPTPRLANEGISYQITNSGAGPTDTYVFSWLRRGHVPAPVGEILTMRGTSTTASVANTWTTISMTWEPNLPSGSYTVIGGGYYAATGLAFSCIFDGQFWRPGALGHATEGVIPWRRQRFGGLGQWGVFGVQAYPRIRVLNGGAVSAHTVYLDVVRTG